MIQADVTPVTWAQVLYEIQRNWATNGAQEDRQISIDHVGNFGMAVALEDFLTE